MCVYYPDFQGDNQTTRAVTPDLTTRQGVLVDTEASLDAFFSREVVIIELVLQTIFFCILVSLRVCMAGGHSADATAQSRREDLMLIVDTTTHSSFAVAPGRGGITDVSIQECHHHCSTVGLHALD